MRVVFLGTPEFAVPSLRALLDSHHPEYEIVGVITQPDRPAGRGQKLTPSPVKRIAGEADIPVFQPERIRDNPQALEFLREKRPELAVVAAFGQILPCEFFDFPPLGSVNLHASLLPKYRGASPVVHALLNGERETGVAIMKINEGMDTGDVLSRTMVPVGEDMTAGELEALLAEKGAELLLKTIPGYAGGEIQPRSQDHHLATYAPRLRKKDARIAWNLPAGQIHNRVRAFNPWPGAFAHFRGEPVKIWRSQTAGGLATGLKLSGHPGTVLSIQKDAVVLECGAGTVLLLKELQLPSRKRVSAADFVNGTKLQVGETFG